MPISKATRPASSYIHFVSHAVASELVPLDSAVILSPDGTPDSAKLYARDILSKPLHARLVTISACQGSGVRAYAGEGLVGLAWAFLRAGSRNVIGALWDVSDASTPELMEHLYDGIAAGQPPDVSLRAAKLELLHSRGVFRKPHLLGSLPALFLRPLATSQPPSHMLPGILCSYDHLPNVNGQWSPYRFQPLHERLHRNFRRRQGR